MYLEETSAMICDSLFAHVYSEKYKVFHIGISWYLPNIFIHYLGKSLVVGLFLILILGFIYLYKNYEKENGLII